MSSYWDGIMEKTGVNTQPDSCLVKFVQDMILNGILKEGDRVLEIGTGKVARSTVAMLSWGLKVTGIDVSHECLAHYHVSWRDFIVEEPFNLIVDIKTLCHEPDPQIDKVVSSLVPNGMFYSIIPTWRHLSGHPFFDIAAGKEFTRCASPEEIKQMFKPFDVSVAREDLDTIGRTQHLSSWCVEAYKDASKIFKRVE